MLKSKTSQLTRLKGMFADAWRPAPRLDCLEWAEKFRVVPEGTSPEPGPWRTDRVPFMGEPMLACSDNTIEMLVLMCSSQIGKSELLLNCLGYYIGQSPTSILFVQPTIEAAEAFSKERIEPTLLATPSLACKLDQGKDGKSNSRKSSETIRLKTFQGGYLALVGANAPVGLASRSIRVLLCDEIDRYPPMIKEGNPLALAIQRTTNYFNRKIVLVSTPTTDDESIILRYFNQTDKRSLYLPCPHCGEFFVWKWNLVEWDRNEDKSPKLETCRLVCPFCSKVVRGNGKPDHKLLQKGEWRAENPSAPTKYRGYHLNALVSPWTDLSALVAEFSKAMATKKGLQEFWNLKLGRPFSNEFYVSEWREVFGRREWYGETLPSKVLCLTAGVDVQGDRLEIVVLGWGLGHECWGVQYARIKGDPKQLEVWNLLDQALAAEFMTEDGRSIPISSVCVDSGDGTTTQEVYYYTAPREAKGIFAIKGRGGNGVPFINNPTRSNRFKAWLFVLGVNAGKALLHSRLKTLEPGPGFVHFPLEKQYGFGESYFRGLYSERLETKKVGTSVTTYWRKVRERNEGLDCTIYAMAALEILNPDLEGMESMRTGKKLTVSYVQNAQEPRRVYSRGIELY